MSKGIDTTKGKDPFWILQGMLRIKRQYRATTRHLAELRKPPT